MSDESTGKALLKAALVAAVSVLPLLIILYQEQPTFRWAVDELIDRHTYPYRVRWFQRHWNALPGWRQELWNHSHPVPPELREPFDGQKVEQWMT